MTFNLTVVRFMAIVAILVGLLLPEQAYAKTSSQRWDKTSHILARVSHESGVPVEHLAGFVAAESNFDAKAKNRNSSATGHFGFTTRTWRVTLKSYGQKYGLSQRAKRTDPYANIAMGAEYLKENQRWLDERMHRKVTFSDLYMANLVSPAGVMALERARGHWSAARVLPQAAASNRSLFYYKNGTPLTVAAFKQRIYRKYINQVTAYQSKAKMAYDAYATKHLINSGDGDYMSSATISPIIYKVGMIGNHTEFTYLRPERKRQRTLFDQPVVEKHREVA